MSVFALCELSLPCLGVCQRVCVCVSVWKGAESVYMSVFTLCEYYRHPVCVCMCVCVCVCVCVEDTERVYMSVFTLCEYYHLGVSRCFVRMCVLEPMCVCARACVRVVQTCIYVMQSPCSKLL